MIRIGYILLLAMLALPMRASGAEPQNGGQAEPHQKEQPVQQENSSKPQAPLNTDFHPRERINADTVVAFPADI